MRVETYVPQGSLREVQAFARRAEEAGFDGLSAPEVTVDPFLALGAAALATERMSLRTSVALAFPRSPMVTANLAWNLHVNTGGRFVLGLGTQVKGHIERRFGVPWVAPLDRLRDYAGAVRAVWRAWEKREPLDYRSEHYSLTLMTPEFSPAPSGLARVPIYFAAVRPHALELAGEIADGVRLHGFCTRRYLEEVALPALERGLARSGHSRGAFEICGGGFLATGPTEADAAELREWVRYRIAFYGSTRTYAPVMELHGWQALAEQLHAYSKQGRWSEMARSIPDEVLDEFATTATYATLGRAVERRFGGLTDTIELALPGSEATRGIEQGLADVHALPTHFTTHGNGWD